jgi:hypothetical protein
LKDRIELHRRMAEGYHDAYKRRVERGAVIYPDEWQLADDAVYWSSYFGTAPLKQFHNQTGASQSDSASREAVVYATKLPDFAPVEFMSWPSENGAAWRSRFEGHTTEGVKMGFYAVDFILTNPDGLITRWETFVDSAEFGDVLELCTGVRGPFKDFHAYRRELDRVISAGVQG